MMQAYTDEYRPPKTQKEFDARIRAVTVASLINRHTGERSLPSGLGYVADGRRRQHFPDQASRDLYERNYQFRLRLLKKSGFSDATELISNADIYRLAMVRGHNPAETMLIKLLGASSFQPNFIRNTAGHIILEFGGAGGEVTKAVLGCAGEILGLYNVDIVPSFLKIYRQRLRKAGILFAGNFREDFTNPFFQQYCFNHIRQKHPDKPIHSFVFGHTPGNFNERDPFDTNPKNLFYNIASNMRPADPATGMPADKLTVNVAHLQDIKDLRTRYIHASTDYFLYNGICGLFDKTEILGLDLEGLDLNINISNGAGALRQFVCTREQTWKLPNYSENGELIKGVYTEARIVKGEVINCFPSLMRNPSEAEEMFSRARCDILDRISNEEETETLYTLVRAAKGTRRLLMPSRRLG